MKASSPILISFTILLSILVFACGKPSRNDIEIAVTESLKKQVPVSLARHLTGGQNATVEEVRVIQIGKAQGEGDRKYWPVKIYARGTCTKMFGSREPFEGETEYFMRKDPYGKWTAQPSGF